MDEQTTPPARHDARLLPLDLLRAAAILLVVLFHLPGDFLPAQGIPGLAWLKRFGWAGVDLFFVLSGWLIGGLYFREERAFGRVRLRRFWIRRFFRTLPPYFVVLFATLAFARASGVVGVTYSIDLTWPELVFLQNYAAGLRRVISVSWSLCVEEHFYLTLPIILGMTKGRRKVTLYGLPALIAALAAYRSYVYLTGEWGDSTWYIYTRTHFRLDNLLIGVWLAQVAVCHERLWQSICLRSRAIGIAGLAGIVCIATVIRPSPWNVEAAAFLNTGGFTIIGLCFAGLTVEAAGGRSAMRHVPAWIVTPIALSSYSVYLLHHQIANLSIMLANAHSDGIAALGWLPPVAYLAASAVAGAACYFAIERPVIVLRDRFYPRRSVSRQAGRALAPISQRDAERRL